MNKKKPNNIVTEVEGDEEEVNPNQFQDDILSCLREVQHLAATIKERADKIEHEIKRFKTSIHGEHIDA